MSFAERAIRLGTARPPDSAEMELVYQQALEEARALVAAGKLAGLELPEPEPVAPSDAPPTALPPAVEPAPEANFPDYPPHPIANLLPPMSADELRGLADDIAANGLQEPIVLHDGQVLDGRHRQNACRLVGVPPRYVEWDGRRSPVAFVVSKNLVRRHLSDQQRAMVAARAKLEFEQEARARSAENLKQNKEPTEGRNPAPRSDGKTANRAAKMLNVSVDATKKATRVLKLGDTELVAAVERETVSLDAAAAVATLPKAEQRKVVAKGKDKVKAAAKTIRAKKKAMAKAPRSSAKADSAAASTEPEPTTEPESPPATSPPKAEAPTIGDKEALVTVLRVVRQRGPATARKVIDSIAKQASVEVWTASDDPLSDLRRLDTCVRQRLGDLAASDFASAYTWLESSSKELYKLLEKLGTQGDVEDDVE